MKNSIYAFIFIISLFFPACENDCNIPDDLADQEYYSNEIFDESFVSIYGDWNLFEVSGGIHGSGHELNFDQLQIRKFGIYAFIKGGVVLESGKIVIDEQTNDSLKISFSPDEDSQVFTFDSEKEIVFQGSDSLILQSPCCDRFNYHLLRE